MYPPCHQSGIRRVPAALITGRQYIPRPFHEARPGRTESTPYCTLFSVWTDKYDVQTLFSVHSGRKFPSMASSKALSLSAHSRSRSCSRSHSHFLSSHSLSSDVNKAKIKARQYKAKARGLQGQGLTLQRIKSRL